MYLLSIIRTFQMRQRYEQRYKNGKEDIGRIDKAE
jgi:hypothetical protein